MARSPDPPALDRFQHLTELGRGGMGVVYRAHDPWLGRDVAIKLVQGSSQPERLARFAREGQVTAGLQHPGIVRVHATGVHEGRPYLVYELVEGGRTLAEAMPGLPREARLRLVQQVAEALGFAHARGVIHRDVKPENVLVDAAGQARVVDFGLATACDLERLTQSGALLGTPSFMAPEQLEGRELTPATDVWALGVLLYEALCDRLPFRADNLVQLAAVITSHDPPPPCDDPALNSICATALARDPRRRYHDGRAFADDLARALRGEALGRRRLARWALGLALALGVGGAAWSRAATSAPESPAAGPGEAPAATSPTPRAPGDGGTQPRSALPGLGEDPQLLRHGRGGQVHAAWLSASRVLTWDDQGAVALWDPEADEPLRRWEVPELQDLAVAPSGVAVARGDGWLGRLPIEPGDPPLARTRTSLARQPDVFVVGPTGRRCYLADPVGSVTEFDLDRGEPTRSFEPLEQRGMWALAVAPDGSRLVTCGAVTPDSVRDIGEDIVPIRIYDLERGQPLGPAVTSPAGAVQAAFLRDSSAFALGLVNGYVMLWSRDGTFLRQLEPPGDEAAANGEFILRPHQLSVMGLAVHPDGQRLLTGAALREAPGQSGLELRLWDARSGAHLRRILRERFRPKPGRLAIAPDGARVLLETGDGAVRVWRLD